MFFLHAICYTDRTIVILFSKRCITLPVWLAGFWMVALSCDGCSLFNLCWLLVRHIFQIFQNLDVGHFCRRSGSKSLGLGYMICAQFVLANAIYRSKKSHGNWNIRTFEIISEYEFRTIVCPSKKFRRYLDISVLFNTFQYISVYSVRLCISIGSIYQLIVNKDRVHM